jgi:hypothetical protein
MICIKFLLVGELFFSKNNILSNILLFEKIGMFVRIVEKHVQK